MVLMDFSLKIKRGSILAILGHNGTGKTILLRLLGKLIQPHKVSIRWNLMSDEKLGVAVHGYIT
jgi:ABC-type multidrug transport system ATPase subunit